MWSFDAIELRNPAGKGQRTSILSRLQQILAARPRLLCETSDELERRGPPFVCCFGQLPYPVAVEPGDYTVEGSKAYAHAHFNFCLFALEMENTGEIHIVDVSPDEALRTDAALGTQVRAFVPITGRREDYHKNYLQCLSDEGLEERIINPSLWDSDHAPAAYKGKVVTAHAFEAELADRMASELRFVLRRFLLNYSVVSLDELPLLARVYGCFLMSAPGRIVYSDPPDPILAGMLNRWPLVPQVSRVQIAQALRFGVREIDRYQHQMLAMQRLAKQGEPQLALLGCVTAIEWFMNSFLKAEGGWSLSIRDCLNKAPFKDFPRELKSRLHALARERNAIAHGQPPERHNELLSARSDSALLGIRDAVDIGFSLYREINLRRLQPASAANSAA